MSESPELDLQHSRASHEWLLSPLSKAVDQVTCMPFFSWMEQQTDIEAYKPVANQIYYHSLSLPRAIGLMLSSIPDERSDLYVPLTTHAYEEADHHLLLVNWMISHSLIEDRNALYDVAPTVETSSCINLAYEIALARDCDAWLACMNSAIELCFFKFFEVLAPKMRSLGAGHKYFDVHVEADASHSIIGLQYLSEQAAVSPRSEYLIRSALNSVSLWASMVHSWIGVAMYPKFSIQGEAVPKSELDRWA